MRRISGTSKIWSFLWLVTDKAANGYLFGYELSKLDEHFQLLPEFLAAQRRLQEKRTGFFLGGYFRGLFERNRDQWEKYEFWDRIAADEELRIFIAELTWRSGLTDRSVLRLLELAKKGEIHFGQLRFFSYGGILQNVSEDIFQKIVEFLLEDQGAAWDQHSP